MDMVQNLRLPLIIFAAVGSALTAGIFFAFFGPAVACLILTMFALRQWEQPGAIYWLAGSLLYLIGTIAVMIAGNIPLNDALAIVSPDSSEGTALWVRYLAEWTFWNHVRTIAAFLAAVLFAIALCRGVTLETNV